MIMVQTTIAIKVIGDTVYVDTLYVMRIQVDSSSGGSNGRSWLEWQQFRNMIGNKTGSTRLVVTMAGVVLSHASEKYEYHPKQ